MNKKLTIIALLLTVIFAFSACQSTDVIAKVSVTSFDSVLKELGDKVSSDEKYNAWAITSPTGGEKFLFGKDFSGIMDTMLIFDAAPFLNAGLDPSKLPADTYFYDQNTKEIMVNGELGSEKFSGQATPIDTFKQIVKTHRASIGYHEKLDHYGIAMGNGNMFEWAKDMSTNDKDIVYVLNPKPFIDAGVDPAKVEGWVFAKVDVKDPQGKPEKVDKFLKPFNLK